MKKFNVAAIIPCRNEKDSIATTINSLIRQSYRLSLIVVVDDASTDGTLNILKELREKIPSLTIISSQKQLYPAAALNLGLKMLPETIDLVLRLDADTTIDRFFVSIAVKNFRKNNRLGGLCGRAGLKPGRGLLYRLQKLEYGNFDAERTATFDSVLVLHGMCSMFKKSALLHIKGFKKNHRIEDYEATLRLKYAGFQAQYLPQLIAETLPPITLGQLLRQRFRWMRGGIDILLAHGVNKHTISDFVDHLFFLTVLVLLVFLALTSWLNSGLHFRPHIVALALGLTTYITSLYRLKFVRRLDIKDIFLRVIIFPELILSVLLSLLQLWAYATAVFDMIKAGIISIKNLDRVSRLRPVHYSTT